MSTIQLLMHKLVGGNWVPVTQDDFSSSVITTNTSTDISGPLWGDGSKIRVGVEGTDYLSASALNGLKLTRVFADQTEQDETAADFIGQFAYNQESEEIVCSFGLNAGEWGSDFKLGEIIPRNIQCTGTISGNRYVNIGSNNGEAGYISSQNGAAPSITITDLSQWFSDSSGNPRFRNGSGDVKTLLTTDGNGNLLTGITSSQISDASSYSIPNKVVKRNNDGGFEASSITSGLTTFNSGGIKSLTSSTEDPEAIDGSISIVFPFSSSPTDAILNVPSMADGDKYVATTDSADGLITSSDISDASSDGYSYDKIVKFDSLGVIKPRVVEVWDRIQVPIVKIDSLSPFGGSATLLAEEGDEVEVTFPTTFGNQTVAYTTSVVASAISLANSRTINGVPFDGTANITVAVPVASGVTGLGGGVATMLATFSSANIRTACADETGTGSLVFGTSPTITTPIARGAGTAYGTALSIQNSGGTATTIVSDNGNVGIGGYLPSGHTVTTGYRGVWLDSSNSAIMGETTAGFRGASITSNAVRTSGNVWAQQDSSRNSFILGLGYEASNNGLSLVRAAAGAGNTFVNLLSVDTNGTATHTTTSSTAPALIVTGPTSGVDTMQIRGTGNNAFSSIGLMDSANVQRGSFGFGGSTASSYASTVFFNAGAGIPMSFGTNATERMRISSAGGVSIGVATDAGVGNLLVNGVIAANGNQIRIVTSQTPASASAAGSAGTICWDANYIYVCVATNTWKRTAISTW